MHMHLSLVALFGKFLEHVTSSLTKQLMTKADACRAIFIAYAIIIALFIYFCFFDNPFF